VIELEYFSPLGEVRGVVRRERGVSLALGNEHFDIDVVRPDLLRFALSRAGRFEERPTFATDFTLPPSAAFELEDDADAVTLTTTSLRLVVQKADFHVDVFRADGSVVFQSARSASGRTQGYLALNDALAVSRVATPSDAVFGLGQKSGRFDRRGRRFVLWNIDVLSPSVLSKNRLLEDAITSDAESTSFDPYYSSTPFFYHATRRPSGLLAAGFFIDNAYLSRFDFNEHDVLRYQLTGGAYVEYVFAGPKLADILEAYTFLTGRMPLPPLWSLGHQQCRWHDYSDQQVLAVGREYRERGIPCDALWLDIGHMEGHRVFSFHPERFPEPERLAEELFEEGFRCVTIVNPGVKLEPGLRLFEEGRAGNLFCRTESGGLYEGQVWPGRAVFPDFVQEKTRAWWGGLVKQHAERGVAGIWNDMNEPATGAIDPFAMRFDHAGENAPHERYHNQYALLMAVATQAGLLAARPLDRPFTLTRAGFAGIQRYAAQWLGDHSSTFAHLEMGVAMSLGLGISGQPFVGADVPGYARSATPELAARWFEYAALTPFCRCHHQIDQPDHYPWSFGPEVEAIARAALELRYRLLPYLYAAFVHSSRTGAPVQRPLVFDFQDDPRVFDLDDQFLLGDALLVAPVLREGREERTLYLPAGNWTEWSTGRVHAGASAISVAAPLAHVPLFVREGAVLPLLPEAPASTLGLAPELIELHVFIPANDGKALGGVLYEDDGITLAHLDGAYLRTDFDVERRGNELSVRARTLGGGYPEHRRERFSVVLHGYAGGRVTLDDREVVLENGAITFDCGLEGFELTVTL
jgi:alpha-glucosidase